MNFDATFTLAGGRTLGYAVYGAADGVPVVALHGSPDSRVIWRLANEAAHRVGVRVIAPDRPGFGISDPSPGRTVLGWCDDLTQLVDHLECDRFGLLAISGGGIYASAYAWQHPERVSRLGLFSVLGPLDGPDAMSEMSRRIRVPFQLVRRFPALTRPMARGLCRMASRNPKRVASIVTRSRPVEDRDIIARPEMQEVLFDNLPNQFRDPETIAAEVRASVRPWPFALDGISVPTIIWQGGRDDVHTPAMARHLADQIPDARLEFEPGFATFNFFDGLDNILTALTE